MHDCYESLRIRLEGSAMPVNWKDIPKEELPALAQMSRQGYVYSNAEGDIFAPKASPDVPCHVVQAGLAALYEMDLEYDCRAAIVQHVYKTMREAEKRGMAFP